MLEDVLASADRVGALLKARGETIAVAESSTGGLISAALLSVGGASAYYVGGAVVYTRTSRAALLGITAADMSGIRPSTEAYASFLAERVRLGHGTVWGIAETGASGPARNSYGDAAGHCCIGLAGPRAASLTIETGQGDRRLNMTAFAARALRLLEEQLAGT